MTAIPDRAQTPLSLVVHQETSDAQDAAFARAVGAMLRAARTERNWTPAETGDQVGLSASVLCRVEPGVRPLDMTRFARLCMALEVVPAKVIEDAQRDAFPMGWRELW